MDHVVHARVRNTQPHGYVSLPQAMLAQLKRDLEGLHSCSVR